MKKKILLVSDSPLLNSGLGRWCRELAYRLTPYYEIAVAGWHYNNQRHNLPFHVYPIQKMSSVTHEQVASAVDDFSPDIVMGLGDLDYFLNFYDLKKFFEKHKIIKWIMYLTVDGQPLNPYWRNALEYMDDVIVCTEYGKKWVNNLSEKINPKVIPLGYSQLIFCDTHKKELLKAANNYKDTFVILTNQQNTVRHNLNSIIWAYKGFLDKNPDAKSMLIMNCDPQDPAGPNLKFEIKRANLINKIILGDNNSVLKTKGDVDINGLYNLADIAISASCNEGFGLPSLEGLACGLPSIVNDYSSLSEMINDEIGWKVNPSSFLTSSIGIRQAIINHNGLVEAIQEAYNEWKNDPIKWTTRREKCKQFAANYTWGDCANEIDKYISRKPVVTKIGREPKLAIISSWNEQCGIAEHTKLFAQKLTMPYIVFACEKRTPYNCEEDENVIRCWERNFEDYNKLLDEIKKNDISIIHIQHEFSFFENSSNLYKFIKAVQKRGVKVVITFHTAVNIHNMIYVLAETADYATFCFKAKPKWIEDIPYANIQNAVACHEDESKESVREKLGIKSKHVIVSNGFWQPHKGYLEIINLIPELVKEFDDILYIIVGGQAPDHPYVKKVKETIKNLKLEQHVIIDDVYVPEDKLFDYLHAGDVIVYNYHIQFESSSAAVLTGLASHRPVITTASPMFDNLSNEVIKVELGSPVKLQRAITELLKDEDFGKILVRRADALLKNITPEIIAAKYDILYKELECFYPVEIANPEICIGIPTYNDYQRVDDCIKSIRANTDIDVDYVIKVVDDGSTDRTKLHNLRMVCKNNDIELIEHEYNRGIPSAWNTLTKATDSKYIVLFNDDIRVIDRNWLKAAKFFMDNNENIGSVGFPLIQVDVTTGKQNVNYPVPDCDVDIGLVGAAVGCSFMFSREAYNKTLGFWEDLVSFYEEIDFGFQMIDKGYMNVMLPYPAVEHWGSQTFSNNQELQVREIDENILSREEYLTVLQEYKTILTIKYEQHVQLSSWNKAYRMDYSRCLPPDEAVITTEGATPICNVKKGDNVLTHKGQYKKVTNTFSREYKGDLVSIKSKYSTIPLAVTPEHKVLTAVSKNSYRSNSTWYPKKPYSFSLEWKDAKKVKTHDYMVYPIPKEIRYIQDIEGYLANEDLMSIFGWYISDGCLNTDKGIYTSVHFSLGLKDVKRNWHKELAKNIENIGLKPRILDKGNVYEIHINNRKFAKFIHNQIGNGCHIKKLPEWVMKLSPLLQKSLWESALKGDGFKRERRGDIGIGMVNINLITQLRDIALRLGLLPKISCWKMKSNGYRQTESMMYELSISKPGWSNKHPIIHEGMLLARVQKIKNIPYKGKVYNLEVEDDNTYCTVYHTVHNCLFSKKWKCQDRFINPQLEVHNKLFAGRVTKKYKWLDKNMQPVEKEM